MSQKTKGSSNKLVMFDEILHLGKVLHYRGFKFIVRREKSKKDEDIYVATTPHYNNGASGVAGTISSSPVVTAYRMIKILQNLFLSVQIIPKIGDSYHDFDECGLIRTIVDVQFDDKTQKYTVSTVQRPEGTPQKAEMFGQIMIHPKSLAANISLALLNNPNAKKETFVCEDFANMSDAAEKIAVDGRSHIWDLFVWKGINNAEQVQSPQAPEKPRTLRAVDDLDSEDASSSPA